jgi:hypothetical protein
MTRRDERMGRLIALALAVVVGALVWAASKNIGLGGLVLVVVVIVAAVIDARR